MAARDSRAAGTSAGVGGAASTAGRCAWREHGPWPGAPQGQPHRRRQSGAHRAVAVAGRRAWRQGGPRPRAPLEHHLRPRAWGVQPRRRVGGYGGNAGRGRAGLQGSRTVAGVGGAAAASSRRVWWQGGPRPQGRHGQQRSRGGRGGQPRRRVGGHGGKACAPRSGGMLGSLGGGDVCRQRAFEEVGDAGL